MECQFVNGTPEDYVCAICTLVARNPHQVSCCGGIFCKDCIQKFKKATKKPPCPLCRKSLSNYKCFKDSRAERYIKNLKIYCTNKSNGCTWDGSVNEMNRHRTKTCEYKSIKCPDCKEEIMRKFLDSHLADHCPEREVSCPNCKEVGAYSFITSDEHIDECPDATVPCPNEGCGKEMYRKLLQSHIKVCPKEIISCSYSIAGCCVTTTREAVMEHEHQFTQEHLHMALDHIQQQDTKIQEQDTKIQEQDIKIQEQDTKIQEQDTKIQEQGATIQQQDTKMQQQDDEIRKQKVKLEQQDTKLIQQDAEIQALKHRRILQNIFSIRNFQTTRKRLPHYYSPSFYMPSNGYKMNISIAFSDVNHLGYFVYLQQGDYDDMLEWPFRGEVTIELLNQLDDKDHYKNSTTFDSSTPESCSSRPTVSRSNEGWGKPQFISYSNLSSAYLQNDTVFFRITAIVHSTVKSWLTQPED